MRLLIRIRIVCEELASAANGGNGNDNVLGIVKTIAAKKQRNGWYHCKIN
jgi:hypothetical protein